ncbi:hypothetical protein G8S55_03300 [Clostridium botulinum C]|uniref:hypothetical protein n=1 Tax=Clostridium botulinum TaxID=1491 RepID=UPI001E3EF445|nr:hypothetical protein [Clostridium botulinum]MCD3216281.1 hypothetical protein [Clostridium botulinum C]
MTDTSKLNRCKLREKLKVYCPIMKAGLCINSTLIEQMGEFTQFILYSLGKGFNIDDINITIELGEYLIREEIFHLEKWGLIESNEHGFVLTELGKSYFKVIEFVEYINNSSTEVQINCFNGIIMEDDGVIISEDLCEHSIQKLKVDIVKELYQNKNYGNSKEFFIDKFNFDIYEKFNLCEDEIDSINISLNYQKGSLYKLLYLDEIDTIDMILNREEEDDEVDISIVRQIVKLKINLENQHLEKYRYTLDTLRNINLFDNELLSPKAKNIIDIWQEEQVLQNNIKDVFYDTATKQLITDFVKNSSDFKLYKLNIPRLYDVNELDYLELKNVLNLDENYKVQFVEEAVFNFYNHVNSKYLQKEIGDGQ